MEAIKTTSIIDGQKVTHGTEDEMHNYVFVFLRAGWSVKKDGARFKIWKGKEKVEFINYFHKQSGWHFGEVDTFSSKGKWISDPRKVTDTSISNFLLFIKKTTDSLSEFVPNVPCIHAGKPHRLTCRCMRCYRLRFFLLILNIYVLKILVACEESQAVTIEFRKRGHEAYSNDIQDCSGGHPEWHLKGDIFKFIEWMDWDLMIGFPPCTHLAVSGAAWFEQKRKDGRQQQGIDFFMKLANAPIKRIGLENPVGIMSSVWRKPDQIIQPYFFGDEASKKTCLWLKNLPPLFHAKEVDLFNDKITHVGKGEIVTFESGCKMPKWYADAWRLSPEERSKVRSKTFPGIAKAMAEQWGIY